MIAGYENTGKTTVLKECFRNWLKAEHQIDLPLIYNNKETGGEFTINGKKFALNSMGDYFEGLIELIVKYTTYIDTLIITGNLNKKRIERMVNAIKKNKDHCVIEKKERTPKDNQRVLNEIIAAM